MAFSSAPKSAITRCNPGGVVPLTGDAKGKFQAAEWLSQAAGVIAREPGTLTLRTLQTLAEVATAHNSTLVLPIPIDVLEAVRHHAAGVDAANGQPASIHQ